MASRNSSDRIDPRYIVPGLSRGLALLQLFPRSKPAKTLVEPTAADLVEKKPQYEDDKFVAWNKDASSADIAYVLYQVPVLVAVHASEMLPK